MPRAFTESEEEYLEAIYRLNKGQEPVPLGLLAKHLNFSPVSVNEMVRKLADKSLVSYKPYAGVSLTQQGRNRAETMLRRHRLWERFLTDVLDYPWPQVHEEACRLEHVTSELLEAHLVAYLKEPRTCPHGRPLPGLQSAPQDAHQLAQSHVGELVRVKAILDENVSFLRALDQAGMRPGALLEVVQVEPVLNSITVQIGSQTLSLAADRAQKIMVSPAHLDPILSEPQDKWKASAV